MTHRMRMRLLHAIAVVLCTAAGVHAGAYNASSDELVQQYAADLNLEDLDGDGVVTDMDFSMWVIDRVFAKAVPDYGCDGVIDTTDGILAMASELAGLSADLDDNDVVDEGDLGKVIENLGQTGAGGADGDLTGDDQVDGADVLAAMMKVGQAPPLDPIDVAVALLDPLIGVDPLDQPAQIPPDEPCPQPELCGNATCKAKCYLGDTGVRWTYRLFMIGFCGSQFEADSCCQSATAKACDCSPDGFEFDCWIEAQGAYIVCLLAIPG